MGGLNQPNWGGGGGLESGEWDQQHPLCWLSKHLQKLLPLPKPQSQAVSFGWVFS